MPIIAKITSNPGGVGVGLGEGVGTATAGEGAAGIVHQTCP